MQVPVLNKKRGALNEVAPRWVHDRQRLWPADLWLLGEVIGLRDALAAEGSSAVRPCSRGAIVKAIASLKVHYPLQLAFILLNLTGVAKLDHQDRNETHDAMADLLWFPKGGGKTEHSFTVATNLDNAFSAGSNPQNTLMKGFQFLLSMKNFIAIYRRS